MARGEDTRYHPNRKVGPREHLNETHLADRDDYNRRKPAKKVYETSSDKTSSYLKEKHLADWADYNKPKRQREEY